MNLSAFKLHTSISEKLEMILQEIDTAIHIETTGKNPPSLLKEFLPIPLRHLPILATQITQEDFLLKLETLKTNQALQTIITKIKQEENDALTELLDFLLEISIQHLASDIHLEHKNTTATMRIRVDGIIREIFHFDEEIFLLLSSKIKLEAHLDIHEKRKAQDGRFCKKFSLIQFDFRISTLPTQSGESIVIRILNQNTKLLNLTELGFDSTIQSALQSPSGLIFVTGPTGSGKSTTLYAMLEEIKSIEKKIITIEDPIEYDLDLLTQVAINEEYGFGFSQSLKAILRQDPDIIMVGEIRDTQTLSLAIRSSLTGHLVLSTLHTNDAISSIERLIDMGAKPYLIASVLKLIISQRLVRKLCPHCKIIDSNPPSIPNANHQHFFAPKGCQKCHNTGYSGRIMIVENLHITPQLTQLIAQRSSKEKIQEYLTHHHFKTLLEDGINKAAQGLTSLEEVFRVAGK